MTTIIIVVIIMIVIIIMILIIIIMIFTLKTPIRLILIEIISKWKDTSDYHESENETKEMSTVKILEII